MKITFLGTGSAFTVKNYQTNLLIEQNGKNLLIDAGGDIRFSLKEQGLSYKNIDALYITHLHQDHIGGIEYLAFCSYFDPTMKEKISLIGNNEVIRDLWNNSLKGGLRSIQTKHMSLEEYFDVEMIKKNHTFNWEGIEFTIVQSIHIVDEYSIVPSYGLIFTDPTSNKKIYYSSDSQFAPNQIMDYYKMVDIIIQDCETSPFASGVHAHFEDLKTLPLDIKNKMYLVHFQDNILENQITTDTHSFNISEEWEKKAINNGFLRGFLMKGKTLDFKE
jgi:ribonuclease BN (tRNA processing enzyme)